MDLLFYANGCINRVTATVVTANKRKEIPNGVKKYQVSYREIGTDETRHIYPVIARRIEISELMELESGVIDLTDHTDERGTTEGRQPVPEDKV